MEHADVKFVAGGRPIYAHRAVLSCESEYFDAMFRFRCAYVSPAWIALPGWTKKGKTASAKQLKQHVFVESRCCLRACVRSGCNTGIFCLGWSCPLRTTFSSIGTTLLLLLRRYAVMLVHVRGEHAFGAACDTMGARLYPAS